MGRPGSVLKKSTIITVSVLVFVCAQTRVALAQRGGGHVGGGHFGGGGHVGTPHVSPPPRIAPPSSHVMVFPGARRFPILPPHPIRPVRPIFPIFGPPSFGGFWPGFGLGFGFSPFWGLGCGPFSGWDYGCNALPYDYGYYGPQYGPSNVEPPPENQPSGPQMYEYEYPPTPLYLYGQGTRELAQLYLKDGTVYNVTDYWLVNNELHFRTIEDGGSKMVEHVMAFEQLDLQKTIDMNAQAGFRFVLRNEPIEDYLKDHPDIGAPAGAAPQPGPAGPLSPAAPPQPPAPNQPAQPPQPSQP